MMTAFPCPGDSASGSGAGQLRLAYASASLLPRAGQGMNLSVGQVS